MTVTDYELDLAAKRARLNLEAALSRLPFDDPLYTDVEYQEAARRRYQSRPKAARRKDSPERRERQTEKGKPNVDERGPAREAPTALVTEWKDLAACKDQPGDWAYVPSHFGLRRQRQMRAVELATCQACPVRRECAAAGEDEILGIWGGKLPAERRTK